GMGRSRGGLTSKIHALVDAEGRPVNLRLTGGQIADCAEADALTNEFGEGDILLADKGYDTNAIRARCLVPACDGVELSPTQRRELRDKFFTAAPRPRTPFEQSYSDRKLRPRSLRGGTASMRKRS
ncbi:hypothetical protein C033_01617, partial [Brucella melitensis UK37/05]